MKEWKIKIGYFILFIGLIIVACVVASFINKVIVQGGIFGI